MRKIFLILIILFQFIILFSQNETEKAKKELLIRGEVYIEFESDLPSTELTQLLSIDSKIYNKYFAYLNSNEFDKFLELKINFEVIPFEIQDIKTSSFEDKSEWDSVSYPDYDFYLEIMNSFETNFPSLCRIKSIGKTNQQRDLLFARITSNPDSLGLMPRVMLTSTIHGNEATGYPTLLRLISHLLTTYNSDSISKSIIDNIELWICPLENPDGTFAAGNNSISGAKRYNANNIDLNRNYPNFIAGEHPDNNEYQIETISMMNLFDSIKFDLSANLHGGEEVFNYPWDSYTSDEKIHAENDWFIEIGNKFTDTVKKYSPSYYFNGFSNGITNGGDWYVIYGGRQDFANYYHDCKEVTIEISDTKLINPSLISSHWKYLYRSFLYYILESTKGISIRVRDSIDNSPIEAFVNIIGYDDELSIQKTSENYGFLSRSLKDSIINIEITAPGYITKTFNNLKTDSIKLFDILLKRDSNYYNQINNIRIKAINYYPNPSKGKINIDILRSDVSIVRIRDNKGIIINEKLIEKDNIEMELYNIKNGIYFIESLNSFNKQLSVNKLIIIKD